MDTKDALKIAQDKGLDLVEISPNARPPVTKFMDYGKHLYELEKASRKQKSGVKKQELKGIRLTFKIGEHDLETRLKAGRKFLDQGNKLKVEMRLRGRERGVKNLASERLMEYVEKLDRDAKIEGRISSQGNRLTAIVGVKK